MVLRLFESPLLYVEMFIECLTLCLLYCQFGHQSSGGGVWLRIR